jgi:NADH dehydrogenase
LTGCNTVLHLAAATGKAAKEDYYNIIVNGTSELISNCHKAGVRNILYVSTIAVKYPDKYRYDYAQSKEQAEVIIRNSGLNYAIVRPTIVIGQGSLFGIVCYVWPKRNHSILRE